MQLYVPFIVVAPSSFGVQSPKLFGVLSLALFGTLSPAFFAVVEPSPAAVPWALLAGVDGVGLFGFLCEVRCCP
ncbi:hypothetical protein CCR75_009818 [Bremia lactucae]|uniref:Uncharacterized protein n=1 Tax=Bremia lactucae TaxID=4779 RepID=A0A976IKF4_BRELC|nr:hypothetical protein CCR75_009818 [Bremia lactucae]